MNISIIDLSDEPAHIPTLAEWHHRQWAELNPGRSLKSRVESMRSYLSSELVPSMFVCKYRGQLAGSAAIVARDMESRPELTPWLASVYVTPRYRRLGIGSKLVQHVMLQAGQAGLDKLYLFTPDRAAFYQKLGWTVIEAQMYRGHSVTLMQIDLQNMLF